MTDTTFASDNPLLLKRNLLVEEKLNRDDLIYKTDDKKKRYSIFKSLRQQDPLKNKFVHWEMGLKSKWSLKTRLINLKNLSNHKP